MLHTATVLHRPHKLYSTATSANVFVQNNQLCRNTDTHRTMGSQPRMRKIAVIPTSIHTVQTVTNYPTTVCNNADLTKCMAVIIISSSSWSLSKQNKKGDKFLHSIGRVVISLSYTNESTDEWSRFTWKTTFKTEDVLVATNTCVNNLPSVVT